MNKITGIIQQDGTILGEDGVKYSSSITSKTTILLVGSSWRRYQLIDVIGETVEFNVSNSGYGYNYKLINYGR